MFSVCSKDLTALFGVLSLWLCLVGTALVSYQDLGVKWIKITKNPANMGVARIMHTPEYMESE